MESYLKKILILVCAVLCLCINETVCLYAEEKYTEGEFIYTIEDGSVVIIGYFGNEDIITVPSIIAGLPVSKIEENAFSKSKATKIILPETIMSIDHGAVSGVTEVVYEDRDNETVITGTDDPVEEWSTEQSSGETVHNNDLSDMSTENNSVETEELVFLDINEADHYEETGMFETEDELGVSQQTDEIIESVEETGKENVNEISEESVNNDHLGQNTDSVGLHLHDVKYFVIISMMFVIITMVYILRRSK